MRTGLRTLGNKVLMSMWLVIGTMLASAACAAGAEAPAVMPVKEVTVFKDGHAFVLHEGAVATDADGRVVLDYLPASVLGTFWPYSADPKVKLTAVTAGRRRASVKRTALSIPELLEGNVGARLRIRETSPKEGKEGDVYEATLLAIPSRSAEELARTAPPGAEERLPEKGAVLLLKIADGVKVLPINRIDSVTFLGEPAPAVVAEEFRNSLTLRLDWGRGKPEKTAQVGMVYLQRGLRWIPNYRVEIDGKGKSHLKLQATLINELADLADVKANLVIGVPTFAFQETLDPMSLQQAAAQLSSYFRRDARTAYAFSNAIMSQSARMTEQRAPAEEPPPGGRVMDLGPEVAGGRKNEDLYVFTVEHLTLKKGERMVVPVAEYDLAYKDVYRLDLPFSPPPEVRQRLETQQQAEMARLMAAPKVMHNLRLANKSEYPLTTAPALILRDGRPVAQGLMKYAAVGAAADLEVTAAVDIAVEKKDNETGRTPNAATWHGSHFDRIDLVGKVHLTNYKDRPVEVEVVRHVLGLLDSAGQDGRIEQITWAEGGGVDAEALPLWWYWHSWAPWWYQFNGIGRTTWKFTLEPGKSIDLEYKWHYFWG